MGAATIERQVLTEEQAIETLRTGVPRAILEDRYDGLLMRLEPRHDQMVGDTGKLLEQIDDVLAKLIAGVCRVYGDEYSNVIEDVEAAIRETLIAKVDELGLAR